MRRVLRKSGQVGKTNRDAVIRVYDGAGNVIRNARASGPVQRTITEPRPTGYIATAPPGRQVRQASRLPGRAGWKPGLRHNRQGQIISIAAFVVGLKGVTADGEYRAIGEIAKCP